MNKNELVQHMKCRMSKIHSKVIKAIRKLHRTRQLVFAGEERALDACRKEINDRFKQNKKETDAQNVNKTLHLAWDVGKELRTGVIQAKKKKEGNIRYELRITEETTGLDNVPFNPDAIIGPPRSRGKANSASYGGIAAKADPGTDTAASKLKVQM